MDHSQDFQEVSNQEVASEDNSYNDSRGPSLPRWTQGEIEVLIAAKRVQMEREELMGKRDKMISAESKWKEIERVCAEQQLVKSWKVLKKKWERLMREFKKVWDFQRKVPTGTSGYFEMSQLEKKEHLLPPNHQEYEFMLMKEYVPKHRGLLPLKEQMFDASKTPVQTPPATPTEILTPGQDVNEDEVQQEEFHTPLSNAAATPDYETMGKRKKQKAAIKETEGKAAMTEFMETMALETKKHNETESAFLALERHKHFESQTLRAEKNGLTREAMVQDEALKKASLQMQEACSIRLGGHLSEVAGALRYLADGIQKLQ